jgi:hypothetical protein
MTRKLFLLLSIAVALAAATTALAQTASPAATSTPPQIIFPIPELGNCDSKDACKLYCDDLAHLDACMQFAQTHHLMSAAQITLAKTVRHGGGPGKCTTTESCRAYCNDDSHARECLQFGVKNKLLSQEEASSTQSFEDALKTSGGPGGCTSTQECKAYCGDPAHQTECMQFAELHGFVRLHNEPGGPQATSTASTTRPDMLPPTKGFRDTHGSSTINGCKGDGCKPPPPRLPGEDRFATTTGAHLPLPGGGGGSSGDGKPSTDYSKPPYHCTPAQNDEGACDPDQMPGYTPPKGSELGGAVYEGTMNVLHFFGF